MYEQIPPPPLHFIFTGLELTFFSGVYGTAISNTKKFGTDSDSYIGISGMLIGAGEIIGEYAREQLPFHLRITNIHEASNETSSERHSSALHQN